MSNLLLYKNYNGTVKYSKEDSCLFGNIAVYAIEHGKSLNAAVEKAIENMVG